MKYLIIQKQKGEGCDYTIGCGMTYEFEKFDGPIEEAIKHFSHLIAYPDPDDETCCALDEDDERDLEEAWIIPADAAVKVDLNALRKAHKAKEDAAVKAEQDAKELAEFQRLSKKFKQGSV